MASIPYPPVPGLGRVKLLAAMLHLGYYSEHAESPMASLAHIPVAWQGDASHP
jgi:hypothetical protein